MAITVNDNRDLDTRFADFSTFATFSALEDTSGNVYIKTAAATVVQVVPATGNVLTPLATDQYRALDLEVTVGDAVR